MTGDLLWDMTCVPCGLCDMTHCVLCGLCPVVWPKCVLALLPFSAFSAPLSCSCSLTLDVSL